MYGGQPRQAGCRTQAIPCRITPGRTRTRPHVGAPAGRAWGRGSEQSAITLSNYNGTYCQTVIYATLSLRILAGFFPLKRLVNGPGSGNVMRRRSWTEDLRPGLSARNAEPVAVMRLAALYRRVRAPGDLPGSAWPTEGPHCHSTGGAHPPQVPRVLRLQHEHARRLQHDHALRLQHELARAVGARDGIGEWAPSWLPRPQRRLLWLPAR
jgi:hypothetical protein